MSNPWREWLNEDKTERTLTDHAMKIELRRSFLPGDIRAGLAALLALAPFAFAAGALLATDSTTTAQSTTPASPPSISDDLSTLPSASPSNAIDVVTTQRTTQPRPFRTSEPARPSLTREPLSTATTTFSTPSSTQATTSGSASATTTERPQSPSSGVTSTTTTSPTTAP